MVTKESPKKGTSWLWIAAVIVVLIIILVAYKACSSDESENDESATTTAVVEETAVADSTAVADTVEAEPAVAPEPEPVAEPEPEPVKAQPARSSASNSDIDDMAWRVIRGEFGNVPVRRDQLGSDYQRIQDRVNELYRQGLVH